ncbi:MAG: oxaloacetate decarboxylase [Pygmaiobacter massiliensis]|nr:oxaloacetate decarboxylase [Pygmaiobacter massiliensis]
MNIAAVLQSLEVMVFGMLGILVVMGAISLAVMLLNRLFK